jgi:hypothetical protein
MGIRQGRLSLSVHIWWTLKWKRIDGIFRPVRYGRLRTNVPAYESFVLPPFALRRGSKTESMPHSLISQTWAMSSPSRPLGKERCLNQRRYSSGKSKMGTPCGGYFSFPNIPKGMEVRWISINRLRKSSRSISVKCMLRVLGSRV